uniref:Uncharacterized protein n=1 Tax=Schizophyllum commune (strain H4-8 / FGSC 9210) TaxID=578458 RepID=D8Q117_SCHCM
MTTFRMRRPTISSSRTGSSSTGVVTTSSSPCWTLPPAVRSSPTSTATTCPRVPKRPLSAGTPLPQKIQSCLTLPSPPTPSRRSTSAPSSSSSTAASPSSPRSSPWTTNRKPPPSSSSSPPPAGCRTRSPRATCSCSPARSAPGRSRASRTCRRRTASG